MIRRELGDEDALQDEATEAWREIGESELRAAALQGATEQKERGNALYKGKKFAEAA